MINWLKKNKDIINLTGIEVRLKMPLTTLSQVIKGTIKLPKKWVEPLRELSLEICSGYHLPSKLEVGDPVEIGRQTEKERSKHQYEWTEDSMLAMKCKLCGHIENLDSVHNKIIKPK